MYVNVEGAGQVINGRQLRPDTRLHLPTIRAIEGLPQRGNSVLHLKRTRLLKYLKI